MAIIRATSATALPTARQLSADLGRWVRDSGALTAAPQLAEHVEALTQKTLLLPLGIEVRSPPGDSAGMDLARRLLAVEAAAGQSGDSAVIQLDAGRQAEVRFAFAGDPPPTRSGVPRAPLLVWCS